MRSTTLRRFVIRVLILSACVGPALAWPPASTAGNDCTMECEGGIYFPILLDCAPGPADGCSACYVVCPRPV